jgi:RHS repeat-associated protein
MPESGSQRWWYGATSERPPTGGATPGSSSPSPPGVSAEGGPRTPSAAALPGISLPKGGGAIRGIDEKLAVSQATGTASLTISVFASPARQGLGPKLSLGYDSGGGNGPFGLGWNLGVPAVTRKTSLGLPRYDDDRDSDVFILAGAEDLVPLLDRSEGCWIPRTSTRRMGATTYRVRAYRPRVEAGFARIEHWQDQRSGDAHWRTVTRDNVTNVYGRDAEARISDPDDPSRVFTWLLELTFDDRGNAVRYAYKAEDRAGVPPAANERHRVAAADRYLKRVLYGNDTPYVPTDDTPGELPSDWCFELVLDYGEHDLEVPLPSEEHTWTCRPDPFSSYRSTFEVRTYRLCRRFLMFHRLPELDAEPVLVRSTDLSYGSADLPADPALPSLSLLSSATQTGWIGTPHAGYEEQQLPPLQLSYSALSINQSQHAADAHCIENLVGTFDGTRERWVDLDGEGLQGILTEDEGAWYYKHNVSAWNPDGGPARARFEPLTDVAGKPSQRESTLTDLNGDGHLCAVTFAAPDAGWYEYDADAGWSPMRQLLDTAIVDWASPNLRFVDLNGDGLADLLLTDDDAFTWYPWEVDEGFGSAQRVARPFDEERGPALILADGTGSVYLADMSGDGLADLVRIRNGEVCYWPNLGYGRFGAKVTMDQAPVFDFADTFDQRGIRLADIDGSGTADLVYLGEHATIWFNDSGNSWTAGTRLAEFPAYSPDVQASVFDLLGAGTACAVWTSALPGDVGQPLRYIDLTDGVKPHLLTCVANGLGAQQTLTYAPSTKFYVQDRAAGAPWITRLPFPVHVVERVETEDLVSSTRYVAQHSYHHGFYDGVEREFRGFARVDSLDTDALPAESGIGTFTSTPAISDGEFALAPVWTRTWYHTGAFVHGQDIADRLAAEFWALDPDAQRLSPTILPAAASAEELREACRGLRGHALREEVYALDGTPESLNPYATTEHRYQVDLLQPPTEVSYGAFFAWERESVACHYERNASDPRVSHELSLAIDTYGNPTRHASVGYPRRRPAFDEQAGTLISYSEAEFANVAHRPDWYRLGLPIANRAFELTGVRPTLAGGLFDPDTLGSDAAAATVIPYEAVPDAVSAQRRTLSEQRIVYLRDDLSGPLPTGRVESLALVDASYAMALTPGLLGEIFATKLSATALDALLRDAGAFVDLDGDGNRWVPSSRLFYSADPANPDPTYARAHFFLPQGAIDQWGNVGTVAYDDHGLLVTRTIDAVGNTVLAASNYRVLGPWLVTDPNLNRTGVRYDGLGMVVMTAQMGKLLADGTDEGDHLDTGATEVSPTDDPTTCLKYDLFEFSRWAADPGRDRERPKPVWVRTRARVLHKDPQTPWIESCAYSDGFGRVALTKAQAEPGRAPERDAASKLLRTPTGDLRFGWSEHRWVGSGRVVYDNKGNPVKAYEPFFDSSPIYDDEPDLVDWGVTAITRYDPLGRAFRVDNPDGTYRTVAFDPWRVVSSDENDTVLGSAWYQAREADQLGPGQADAAAKAAVQADTPAVVDLDTLGRTFRSVADNGAAGRYVTTTTLDIEGHVRVTTDALGRAVLTRDYDMAGGELHQVSVDSGERWRLADAGGAVLRAWDSRGFSVRGFYDALRRPTDLLVTDDAGNERVAEQIVYGERLADAQRLNLRAVIYEHRDEAGIARTQRRDFQGNIVLSSRRLLADPVLEVDWAADPELRVDAFEASSTFDALNRTVTATAPDGSVTRPTYNQRSLLSAVTVNLHGDTTPTIVVESIGYDAKAQRQRIAYGNGATTYYAYDRDTFRLIKLTTLRSRGSGPLQELGYTYDPVGNITRLRDDAQQTIFFDGQVVTPSADYTYDALYRLIRATGREHVSRSMPATTWNDSTRIALPLPTDAQAMGNYAETYAYDAVGNFESVVHSAAIGGWTRAYAYGEPGVVPPNNQLTSTTVGATPGDYGYDAHGNIVSMPHLSLMQWDWKDQLQATASEIVSEGDARTTHYSYDAAGQRASKTTINRNGRRTAERIYLGGFEVYREYDPAGEVTLERQSLHVTDGASRICLIETTTVDCTPVTATSSPAPTPTTLTRYQLGNHLGSAVIELDASAAIISYEEYYPYGSSSFQSGRSAAEVSLKRYRYTGKQRDDETGFYYHGARYYISWLARWTATDPAGFVDGPNPYAYVRGNPMRYGDATGHAAGDSVTGLLGSAEKWYARHPVAWRRRLGDIAKWKSQAAANYLNPLKRLGRLDEGEHPIARAALKWLNKAYNENSLTIVIERGIAKTKTIGDLKIIKMVKSGAIDAHEAVNRSAANFVKAIGDKWAQTGEATSAAVIRDAKQASAITEQAAAEALPTLKRALPAIRGGQRGFGSLGPVAGIAGAGVSGVFGLLAYKALKQNLKDKDYAKAFSSGADVAASATSVGSSLASAAGVAAPTSAVFGGASVAGFGGAEAIAAAPHLVGAFAAGAAVGVGIQEGSAYLSKKYLGVEVSPGQMIGDQLTGIDTVASAAVTAVQRVVGGPTAGTEKPAYQQTLGWKIANWLTPTSN